MAGYLSPTLTTAVVLYAQSLIMYCFYIQVVKTGNLNMSDHLSIVMKFTSD